MIMSDLRRVNQAKTEDLRWRLLKLGYSTGLRGLADVSALRVLTDFFPGLDYEQIHQALDYLEDKRLVEIEKRAAQWHYSVTALGVDCCEGNAEIPVGISYSEF